MSLNSVFFFQDKKKETEHHGSRLVAFRLVGQYKVVLKRNT